ncbi:MAG: hypothetical protein ACPKPY_06295 [Nitrososphaeraceae archaeon]
MNKNQCETNYENVSDRIGTECCNTTNTCGYESTDMKNNGCCDDNTCCNGDPINAAKSLLESSFFIAMKEVHVEKLKKIIEKEWGDTIDKTVELTIKTVAKQWHASLSKTTANKEFYSELEKIFKESNKKK